MRGRDLPFMAAIADQVMSYPINPADLAAKTTGNFRNT